jgi:hypothetical protein
MRSLTLLLVPLSLTFAELALAEPPALETAAPVRDSAKRAAPPKAEAPCQLEKRLTFAADFAPYVGTSSSETGRTSVRNFSFNLLGGYAGGLRGFELGSVVNLERACVEGVQVAGALNASGGEVRGVQLSGAVNLTRGEVHGLQVAGAANVTRDAHALQLSGAGNVVLGESEGAQLSGGLNLATGRMRGLQLSGGANVVTAPINGAQIAGGVNLGSADVTGLQLAPLNIAAGSVHGVQLGVVNVAEKSDLSLGVVSINTRGRTQVTGWSALETGFFAAAVKHGGNHWYGLYGLAARAADPELNLVLGFGGDAPIAERFYLGADVVGYWAPHFRDTDEYESLIQPRAYFGVRILKPLSVFAGASYNVLLASRRAKSGDWAPDYAERVDNSGEPKVRLWPGAIVGVRLLSE